VTDPALHFEIHPSSGVPIFRQLMEQVLALIAGGRLQPGQMLPSVRDLSAALGINMMTVSKAYARLEAEGVLERLRGAGMRVCDRPTRGGLAARRDELQQLIEPVVTRALQLGLSETELLALVKSVLRERKS